MGKGFFFVIEGLDGSGKTEISRRLVEILESVSLQKNNIKLTFEPHDPSCGGLFIRQVLLKKRNYDPRTLALAFAANRADHLTRDIIPFLNGGGNRVVICDRYYLSSLVYQSTDEIPIDEIMLYNSGAVKPDLTIFLNASDSTCYQRMRERAESKELFEANLRKIREKYLESIDYLQQVHGDNIIEINADGSKSEVINKILSVLRQHGPDWLLIQLSLPMEFDFESNSKVIAINGSPKIKISEFASDIFRDLNFSNSISEDDLNSVKEQVEQAVFKVSDTKLTGLFIDLLDIFGYKVVGEIPWTETKALDLEYSMPLQITQRGIAIFLTRPQSYSLITKKVLDISGWDVDPELPMVSDFIICFDFTSELVALNYYERDLVIKKNQASPTIILLSRLHIRNIVLSMILVKLLDEFILSSSVIPFRPLFKNFVHKWELDDYWDIAIRETAQKVNLPLTRVDG